MAAPVEAEKVLKTPQVELYKPMMEVLRFEPEPMWRIAGIMVNTSLKIAEGDRLLLKFNPGGRQLASYIAYQAGELGAAVLPRCDDQTVEAAALAGIGRRITPEVFTDMSAALANDVAWSTKVAFVRCVDNPAVMKMVDGKVNADWMAATRSSQNVRVERREWTLIYIPTPAEAALDNMPFDDYVKMFLRACDRNWPDIKAAQGVLIDNYLNPGKTLEIYAGERLDPRWQTHVKMSIEGQTFANSTVDKNVPGSEAFSSPVRGTIEGQWAIPNPVMFNGRALKNIALVFDKGRVVEHYTDEPGGMEWVQQQLDTDEGAREVGEVAFGTNRAFDRPVLNGLFVEKVGGSSHLAIGRSYQLRQYDGAPVNLDNGVRSNNHIDLTRLMLPGYGGGRVVVDGKVIQENGEFLDPRLATLNTV